MEMYGVAAAKEIVHISARYSALHGYLSWLEIHWCFLFILMLGLPQHWEAETSRKATQLNIDWMMKMAIPANACCQKLHYSWGAVNH